MGLFSKRNIDKAKRLAEKNAAKIAEGVDKATDAVNKKTGGKYADKLEKVDQAAHKFAGSNATPDASGPDVATDPETDGPTSPTGTTGTP
jgi:hypothetical protein